MLYLRRIKILYSSDIRYSSAPLFFSLFGPPAPPLGTAINQSTVFRLAFHGPPRKPRLLIRSVTPTGGGPANPPLPSFFFKLFFGPLFFVSQPDPPPPGA